MTMMNFIEKGRFSSLSQKAASAAGLLGAACMVLSLFVARASVAQATTNPNSYVGGWKVTAQAKGTGRVELMNYNGRLTGTLTNAHASMDSNGKLVEFDAIPGAAPIVQATISQGMLVIN